MCVDICMVMTLHLGVGRQTIVHRRVCGCTCSRVCTSKLSSKIDSGARVAMYVDMRRHVCGHMCADVCVGMWGTPHSCGVVFEKGEAIRHLGKTSKTTAGLSGLYLCARMGAAGERAPVRPCASMQDRGFVFAVHELQNLSIDIRVAVYMNMCMGMQIEMCACLCTFP